MIWLVQDDALGEWSSIARLDVKLNGLTFDERLATFSLNLRVVHKDVGLAIDSDESPTLFVVEPLDGSYSHCGPPCFFWARLSPVPEGTTTATSTDKPTGELCTRQMFLGSSNQRPGRRVLDDPAQCNQFVTKSIGLGPVLLRACLVASPHQVSTVRINCIFFRVQCQAHGPEERIDRIGEVACSRLVPSVGGAIGSRERVKEQGDRERCLEVVIEYRDDLVVQRGAVDIESVTRSDLERVARQHGELEASRQRVEA